MTRWCLLVLLSPKLPPLIRMRVAVMISLLAIGAQVTIAQPGCPDVHFKTVPSATLAPTATTQFNVVRQSDGSYTAFERSRVAPYPVLSSTVHFENSLTVCLPSAAPTVLPAATSPANPTGAASQPQAIAQLSTGGYLTLGVGGVAVALLDSQLNVVSTSNLLTGSNVALADVNGDGILDIVAISNGAERTSGQLQIFLGTGGTGFQSPITYSIGTGLQQLNSLTIGDFNGDRKLDIAVDQSPFPNENGSILIYLGNGDGTFRIGSTIPIPVPSGSQPNTNGSIATADLDKDGKLDLAFTVGGIGIAIALGNGDGTFKTPALDSGYGGGIAIGDVNGDGNLDIVTVGTILFGDGKGSVLSRQDYVTPTNPDPYVAYSVILTDFNGDGRTDIVFAGGTPAFMTADGDGLAMPINVLFAQPDGTFFGPAIGYVPNIGNYSTDLRIADFNGDGIPDLAYAGFSGVGALLGKGDGTFSPSYASGSTTSGWYLATGDFNGDKNQDIIALLPYPPGQGGFSYFAGKGDGTFRTPVTTLLADSPAGLAAADFNGDGKLDLAILFSLENGSSTDSVTFYLGNGDGSFRPGATYAIGPNASWLVVGDVNKDGKPDLVIASSGSSSGLGNITILLGSGDGTFKVVPNKVLLNPAIAGDLGPPIMSLADFNQDGNLDLVVLTGGSNLAAGFAVLLGNGDGTFQSPLANPIRMFAVATADVNGDGIPDLVGVAEITNIAPSALYYFLGNGDGTFQPPVSLNVPSYQNLAVGDLNGDGKADIVSSASSFGYFSALNLTSSPPAFKIVSSASFTLGPVATDSFATAVGTGLPSSLANLLVSVTDANGASRSAQVLYASPTQINFLIPNGTALGVATVSISTPASAALSAQVEIIAQSPGLFVENTGGLAAAYAVRVDAQGNQSVETVFNVSNGVAVATPISLSDPSDEVYLILFGTGFDVAAGASVTVGGQAAMIAYAGSQGTSGLDQVNVLLPHSLAGAGNVSIAFSVGGKAANTVRVAIQ